MMTRRAPKRSAIGPPRKPPTLLTKRYGETAALASLTPIPCRVSSTGRNIDEAVRRQRAQHDDDVEQAERLRVGPQVRPALAAVPVAGSRTLLHQPQRVNERARGPATRRATPTTVPARRPTARTPAAPAQSRASRRRCARTSQIPCDCRTPHARAPRPADETPRRRVRRSGESPPASARWCDGADRG